MWNGKKFNCNEGAYWKLRNISDELCRENGLTVIENPKGKTPRKLYFAEKNGEPTRYNLMREAIDKALTMSTNPKTFTYINNEREVIALLRRSAGRSIAGRVKLPLPIIRSKYRRSQPASESCGGRLPPVLTLRWTARWCRIRCKGRRIGGKTRPVKEYIAAPIDFSFFLI